MIAAALAWTVALQDPARALEEARAEATRPYASPDAAAAAWARLDRVRAPLLESDDARAGIWLADAAEDALTAGLAIDGCGLSTLVGLPVPAQHDRAVALLRDALAWTRAAEARARAAIASGAATPELAARLDAAELARRIPLLRASAAVLAARAGALPPADAPAILASAAARLASLGSSLEGPARDLADACAGLALARLGLRATAEALLAPMAARPDLAAPMRTLAIAGLAECASTGALGRRRALDTLRTRHAGGLDDASRLALGDLDFTLAAAAASDATTPQSAVPPPWDGWLDAVSAASPATRPAVRAEAFARIARHCGESGAAVARLARALAPAGGPGAERPAAAEIRACLEAPDLDPALRPWAMLELGRAELTAGRPAAGAEALLAFAEACPADPASRDAIDAAVTAARGTGDALLLARVLAVAAGRFPDHPEHAAWRVELAALGLSADAAPAAPVPAARRAAAALDGLDRADRAGIVDPALRADLAIAAADALSEDFAGEVALAALGRIGEERSLPDGARRRIMEERIRALLASGRPPEADAAVAAALRDDPRAVADAAARVLRRTAALDPAAAAAGPPDERAAVQAARLAELALAAAPADPDRDQVLAPALVRAGRHEDAHAAAERAIAARGERSDLVLARAEALFGMGGRERMAAAFSDYERVARASPEGSPAWWLAQVRRLQVLDRVGESRAAIAPKVARLQAMDPSLGGPAFAAVLLDLAARN